MFVCMYICKSDSNSNKYGYMAKRNLVFQESSLCKHRLSNSLKSALLHINPTLFLKCAVSTTVEAAARPLD